MPLTTFSQDSAHHNKSNQKLSRANGEALFGLPCVLSATHQFLKIIKNLNGIPKYLKCTPHRTQGHTHTRRAGYNRNMDYIRPPADELLSLFVCQACQTFSPSPRCDAYEILILIVHQMRRTKYVHWPSHTTTL